MLAGMSTPRRLTLATLLAGLTAPHARAQSAAIQGTATYRERIALPPGAVLEVVLLDISRQGAPAERIAEASIPVQGQVPITFRLPYDPARIQPQAMYAVQASLLAEGRVLFRSEGTSPVLTRGHGATVEMLLSRAREAASPAAEVPGLVGPEWIAEQIAGSGVLDQPRTSIAFTPDRRIEGSGGCNRFAGGYTLEGTALRIGPAAATMMACEPPVADQEGRFHQALAEVRAWRLEGTTLHLTDAAGATLIRLARGG